jgi:hypothetical protein
MRRADGIAGIRRIGLAAAVVFATLWLSLSAAGGQEDGDVAPADEPALGPEEPTPIPTVAPPTDVPLRTEMRVVNVGTRLGVTVRMVVAAPSSPPHAVVLLFPGGDGAGAFAERDAEVRLGGNFLVRTAPLFVAQGFLAAVVDVPSDRSGGMDDQFRTSEAHVEDVRALIRFLGTLSSAPVYLAGTSRGTISVAHLGINPPDPRVQGIILTASMAQRLGPRASAIRLSNQPLERIGLPTLFVHHRDDGCFASLHVDAVLLPPRMTSSPRVNFITVVGGDPPRSDPCEAMSAHGFLGKERDVVTAISDWVAGRPVPEQIGP